MPEIVVEVVSNHNSREQFIPDSEHLTSTKSNKCWIRSQVHAAANMKMAVCWDATSYCVVEIY